MIRLIAFSLALVVIAGALVYLFANPGIRVVIVEVKGAGQESSPPERRLYAGQCGRYETQDGFIHVVRLDRNEVWVWNDRQRVCMVYAIDDVVAEMRATDKRLLAAARQDPAWAGRLPALKQLLRGEFEVTTSKWTVTKLDYECLATQAHLDGVLDIASLVTQDAPLPEMATRVDLVMAALGGASDGYGSTLYQWRKASRGEKGLPMETKASLSLPAPLGSIASQTRVVAVSCRRMKKDIFEVPKGYRIQRWKR